VAKEKGHEVKVFLMDDAVHWAQLGMAIFLKGISIGLRAGG
jgi:hypothetical protein